MLLSPEHERINEAEAKLDDSRPSGRKQEKRCPALSALAGVKVHSQ